MLRSNLRFVTDAWSHGEENANFKIDADLCVVHMFLCTTQLDTRRRNIVPDNIKATMNASQCSQLDSQPDSGALVAVCGEPLSLVEYASSDCSYHKFFSGVCHCQLLDCQLAGLPFDETFKNADLKKKNGFNSNIWNKKALIYNDCYKMICELSLDNGEGVGELSRFFLDNDKRPLPCCNFAFFK